MVMQVEQRNPWWRKKRWATLFIIVICILSLHFYFKSHFTQRRTQAIEHLRAEMRARAMDDPEIEPSPSCTMIATTGGIECAKQKSLLACEAGNFLDPFDVWAGIRDPDDLEELVKDKYDETRDMQKLAQWFACQGFEVTYENGVINAAVLTPNGYGPFNNSTVPWPAAWADTFSTGGRMGADGRLSMDIGTTYK